MMDDRILADYLRSGRELHQKYEEIKMGKQKKYKESREKYMPIITPIQDYGTVLNSQKEILEDINSKTFIPEQDERVGKVALEYLLNPPGRVDKLYGVYRDDDGIYIGNKPVTVLDDNIYIGDEKKAYPGTRGLWELITLEHPNPSIYDEKDLKNYADIVMKSYTYKSGNNPTARRLKTSSGYKYSSIISPILEKYDTKQGIKKGKGLQKVATKNAPEYMYYNSIDELLERLYILYGEFKAGNNSPVIKNEIVNIISEFKEL